MKGHHKAVVTIVLVVTLFSLGCSLCPLCGMLGLGDDLSVTKHWENEQFSFDYPGHWRTLVEIWGEEAEIGVADPGTATPWEKYLTSVRIEARELPPGSTLKEAFEGTDPQAEGEVSEATTTVDGVVARERLYEKFHGEPLRKIREVWLEKDGNIYIIHCWSTPGHFDEAQADFEVIIGSFHVK
jgi:hypothetical protein